MNEQHVMEVIAVAIQAATKTHGPHKFEVAADNVVRALEAAGYSIVVSPGVVGV